ncbi:acetylglutamate kinase [Alkalicoccus urumqiensis]|uniref:Acetylglutamate kinase n=1 Tax=Alkalicoccus urumqiensis TaxID=1548213 RepID=A0A2P6MKX2_ALKUR|nr:acetylglutamate kinase [Alkalicoccus urumqiensis]PRO66923.1 acetylglutamate kinase [Alkalicoccus urumqiensis]
MKTIVMKIGGSLLEELPEAFYKACAELSANGIRPVIVHGGGPDINRMLELKQTPVTFHDGLRVSTGDVLETAEMVLSGMANKKIVSSLEKEGAQAFGFSGKDGGTFRCSLKNEELGFVGTIDRVDTSILEFLLQKQIIPVLSPISSNGEGVTYNVNADEAASAAAAALHADVLFISDIPGVMNMSADEPALIPELTEAQAEQLIAEGVIYGGMIPKVRAAVESLNAGCEKAAILNGHKPESLLHYLEGKKCGTVFLKEETSHV